MGHAVKSDGMADAMTRFIAQAVERCAVKSPNHLKRDTIEILAAACRAFLDVYPELIRIRDTQEEGGRVGASRRPRLESAEVRGYGLSIRRGRS